MSIAQLQQEQQAIKDEQQLIRKELQAINQKLDSTLRNDLRRITSRMEENEKRLASISGGLSGTATPNPQLSLGKAFASRGMSPQTYSAPQPQTYSAPQPPSRTGQAAAPRSPNSGFRGIPGLGASASNRSFGGTSARMPGGKPKPSDENLAMSKAMITNAVKAASKTETWEQTTPKPAPSATDRVEMLLRTAIERTKEFKKNANNPNEACAAIFRMADANHSGKVDLDELVACCQKLEFQVDKATLTALFNRYDVDHNNTISCEEFSRYMFKQDGDHEYKAKSAIARMREVLAMRAGGFEGLRAMGSQFRIIDRDRSGKLSKDEFSIALDCLFSAYGVKFSPAEKNSLMEMFDSDKSGDITYDQFVLGVRGSMNEFRADWVKQAFQTLDKDGSGVVSTAEMAEIYDPSENPAVKSGKITAAEAIQQFMKHYDKNSDGQIPFEEFKDSYEWVSSSIDTDDYFELMMRNAWHISGGSGWCENTANLRVLVQHTRGADEVLELKNDMGLPHDPAKKYAEIVRRLGLQGVKDIKKIDMGGGC